MNSPHIHLRAQRTAFTLLELLTVIAIIAILMGLLLPVVLSAKERARRVEASTAIAIIVTAAKSYSTDYGKPPPLPAALDGDFYSFGDIENGKCKVNNSELFNVLRAIDQGMNNLHALNRKRQVYLDTTKARDAKNPRGGFCDGSQFTAERQGQYMDPWGAQYCVVLDATGSDRIEMGKFYSDLSGATDIVRAGVVAFSMGNDGKLGGKGYEGRVRPQKSGEARDDIVSWEK